VQAALDRLKDKTEISTDNIKPKRATHHASFPIPSSDEVVADDEKAIMDEAREAQSAEINACKAGLPSPQFKQASTKTITLFGELGVYQATDHMLDQDCEPFFELARDAFYAAQGRQITFSNAKANPEYAGAYQRLLKAVAVTLGNIEASFKAELLLTDRLAIFNRAINQAITYRSDTAHFTTDDYYASAAETAFSKTGDCDDYAMLKYQILKDLGFPINRMFIVEVGNNKSNDLDHAVLMVNITSKSKSENWLILDNQNDGEALIQASQANYKPYYAFNDYGAWVFPQNNLKAGYSVPSGANFIQKENPAKGIKKQ
jgi:predicted transglutaminase-like cysteine proteinase